jgi:uncharacterized protein (DUF1800 family)
MAAALCLLLPGQFLAAQQPQESAPALPAVRHPYTRLDADQRILHLLNRFTFGPTPEEIAAIKSSDPADLKKGADPTTSEINTWFEQQLHPDRLPATAFDQQLTSRLAEYPALQLPVSVLIERFPSGAMIRQTANGKQPLPGDPYLEAIYRRHIDLYEDKQSKKAEAQTPAAASPTMATAATTTPTMPETMATAAKPSSPRPAPGTDTSPPSYNDILVKAVLALPASQRVQRILYMDSAEYDKFHSSLKGPQKAQLTADLTPSERELIADFENPSRTVVEELQAERLLRDIYSSHQLQEVMTTFWLNHFNVFLHKNEETPYYLVSYERDVIRPRALGNFEDLLVATAESPAMLLYLDNSSSTGPDSDVAEKQKLRVAQGKGGKATPPGLNENYARELMELHTLGVNGGYTQKDVTEVAKVFTGWTVDHPGQGGGFKFDQTRHEPGTKKILGKKIKENGQEEGLQLLHILATSPQTAHFISQELAIQFVSDNPPPALVNRMAQSFLHSNGDIPSVLRTMLHSPEFWSPEAYQAKVKTPLEYVVSAARASAADITNPQPLVNALNQMGMPLYGCVPPTGYSDKADAWVSTGELVTRMNFALSLATNRLNGVKPDWGIVSSQASSPDLAEQTLETRLIPVGVSEKTRTAVLNQAMPPAMAQQPPTASAQIYPASAQTNPAASKPKAAQQSAQDKQNAQIAGLLLGSPEFQRR